MKQDAEPLTEEEIKLLSTNAQVVLAARCAARVLPSLGLGGGFHFWKNQAGWYLSAVIAAMAGALLRGVGQGLAFKELRVVAAISAQADTRAGAFVAVASAAAAVVAAAKAATRTTAEVAAVAPDVVATSKAAVSAASDAVYKALVARPDFHQLDPAAPYAASDFARAAVIAADRADWSRLKEAEDPSVLLRSDLWLSGAPSLWEQVTSAFETALAEQGREDVFALYVDLAKGRFDSAGWRLLLERWSKEQRTADNAKDYMSGLGEGTRDVDSNSSPAGGPPAAVSTGIVPSQLDDVATDEDHLGRQALVNALRELLDYEGSAGRLTIGLLGHWGAGKSSVLKMLVKALEERREGGNSQSFLFGTFNAWAYEHTGNIQAGLAQEVVNGLTGHLSAWGKLVLSFRYARASRPWSFWGSVVTLFGLLAVTLWRGAIGELDAAGGVVLLALLAWHQGRELFSHPLAANLQTYLRLPSFGEHLGELPVIQRQVRELCKLCLEDPDEPKRLLFMVDDLDRCGVDGVVKTLEAVRLVMDLPQVTVIVAVDHRMALAALTHHYHDLAEKGSARTAQAIARDYLGKIFQLPIQLGEPSAEGVQGYVNDVLFVGVEVQGEDAVAEREVAEPVAPDGASRDAALSGERASVVESDGKTDGSTLERVDSTPEERIERSLPPPEFPVADVVDGADALEIRPSAPLADSDAERKDFLQFAGWFGFGNPRQLKRLHNCYRLHKALRFHRGEGAPAAERSAMAMLFWLEFLYEQEWRRRKAEEEYLRGEQWPLAGDERPKLGASVYSALREVPGFGDGYESLKRSVSPLMLPFARMRDEAAGGTAAEVSENGE